MLTVAVLTHIDLLVQAGCIVALRVVLSPYGTAGTAPVKDAAILVEGAPRDATAPTKTQGCWLGSRGAAGVDVEGAVGVHVEAEIGHVPTSSCKVLEGKASSP